MNEIGEDVRRWFTAAFGEMAQNAAFPFVEGTAGILEEIQQIGLLGGHGTFVNKLTSCLKWTNAFSTIVGRQFHIKDETVGVFEKFISNVTFFSAEHFHGLSHGGDEHTIYDILVCGRGTSIQPLASTHWEVIDLIETKLFHLGLTVDNAGAILCGGEHGVGLNAALDQHVELTEFELFIHFGLNSRATEHKTQHGTHCQCMDDRLHHWMNDWLHC